MSTQTERTYRYVVGEGTKCGGCNWETSALYVLAPSEETADQLLRDSYGCALQLKGAARCEVLEWEHGRIIGYQGDDRETATPIWEGPHLDHDFEERTEMDGAGMCGECFASMLAVNE
ncbi:MAG: hypothetical protein HY531_02770 [Chloroflexi bacterium]|nr:hypothetical protein [Chloroflexota bacterium]